MTILILGSEGFIGRYLVSHFLEKKHKVVGCDLFEAPRQQYTYHKVSRLSPEWEEVFALDDFDVCINASGSGNVPYSVTHPFNDFEANALDTIKILDTIRRSRPSCRYLHISSAAVYGNPAQLPIQEDSALHPLSPYGWHKLIAEKICTEYSEIYSIPVAIVRPFSVYGNGLQKQLLWDICSKLSKSDSIELFGNGDESRDFIHVSDLVGLIAFIVQGNHFNCEVFNAGSGIETTIKEIATIFQSCYSGKKISFSGQVRVGDPRNWKAGISRAEAIGYAPSVPLQEGVAGYCQWFNSL